MATLTKEQAKTKVVKLVSEGSTIKAALAAVGRTQKTYEGWRAEDADFRRRLDEPRQFRKLAKQQGRQVEDAGLDFEAWRLKFLGRETYPHMRQWIDLLEGREPTDLHENMVYEKARPERVLINTPPFHAKSTILTQEYVVYRICMNPSVRICIVSKTQTKAKKFLYSITRMLTSPRYANLQMAYAPTEGWKESGNPWTATQIYVAGREDASSSGAEKDPTVEVLGIRGDIYGGRYDLIILDDCVTKENVGEHEKQIDWINQEVSSRVYNGRILVVGTRVGSIDLYSELRNPDNFTSGRSPWTYLAQPAVLRYGDEVEDWETLWPRSNAPLDEEDPGEQLPDGTYAAWDGFNLSRVRDSIKLNTWSLVYMQQQVPEDSIFNPVCVRASVNGRRKPGPLKPGAWGHPRHGMEGQYIIASMDPAMAGDTFSLVMAVDKQTKMRRILNCWVRAAPSPQYFRDLIQSVTEEYGVHEWVIEQNAFQLFLVYDEEIQRYCRERGVRITPHYTSKNKIDPDFGVASVAPLFGSLKVHDGNHRVGMDHNGDNLIELADQSGSEAFKALIEQLITWEPGKSGAKLRQDGPMALWFAELRARAILGIGSEQKRQNFINNPYLSRSDRRRQVVVPLEDYRKEAG